MTTLKVVERQNFREHIMWPPGRIHRKVPNVKFNFDVYVHMSKT